jgi:thioredoxin-like negative regulator of GroEL
MNTELTIDELNRRIDDEATLSLLYIYSDSCQACNPAITATMREMIQIDTVAVNADSIPDIWVAFGLSVVPTWLLVGKGRAFAEWPGVLDASAVANKALLSMQQIERSA